MAKVGRKRKAVGWSTLLKLGLTVNFDKNPAVHTFLFENIENEGLSEFIVGLIETHLVANCPHYMDPEYQFKVIKVAREAEEEMLRRKLNARQAEDSSSIKGGVPLMSNASLAKTGRELTFSLVSDVTGGVETSHPTLTSPAHSGQVPAQAQNQIVEQVQSQVHEQEQVRDNFSPPAAETGVLNPGGGSVEGETPAGLSAEEIESNESIVNDLINN